MLKTNYKYKFKNRLILASFIVSIFIISISANSNYFSNYERNETNIKHKDDLKGSSHYLFQGNEPALNITDYGNLYKTNQAVSLTNKEIQNLTYYLDDVHGWKVSKIDTVLNNIQDTRDWTNDSDFKSLNVSVNTVYESHDTFPQYGNGETKSSSLLNISESGALAMRVYFESIAFEEDYDFLFIEDENDVLCYQDTGYRNSFYSPWVKGDTIQVYIVSDSSIRYVGYEITSYEYLNGTFDNNWWDSNNKSVSPTYYGPGYIGNTTAMHISLLSDRWYSGIEYGYYANYSKYDFIEIYQNLTIPRGTVVDGYINFDYYAEFAMESNDFYVYVEINDQKIYSIGLGDIFDAGKYQWHSTNNIYMALWLNNSKIFNNVINKQRLNISVGIKCRSSAYYQGFEDRYQQTIWFDNLTLVLTTIANSTQNGINLTINNKSLSNLNNWGSAELSLTGNWEINPVQITISTTSPSLSFDLDTILYGNHSSTSKIDQLGNDGLKYKILENGTIYWEFYHNLYMPSQYEGFEFEINKPYNWVFISVLDPTLQKKSFEGGKIGDSYLKINSTNALFPGWWFFKAKSPNYLNIDNTLMSKNGQWGFNEFYSGDSIRIKTQINYTDEIPLDLDQTIVNLTINYPNGTMWYQESKIPSSNGTVTFSAITFTSQNSIGGIYNFTLFWTNGTALGGFKSNFTVIHASYITILKPDDAKFDNQTGGTVGDIIPLRIYLRDAENDKYISDALISYNWTTGTEFLLEASLGIYETVLDTADLGGFGLYSIVISTIKIGFINSSLTLRINLGEDTNLQRLESDSKILIGSNSTIRFFYYSEFDEEGIPGAQVSVNITDPAHYKVYDESDGFYSIEFSTEFLDSIGVYRLTFEFSAIGYETQTHIFQFEIINPPVTREKPNYLLLGILFASIGIGSIFAALSLRSYVILPRRRRKESELLVETQRFKDIRNIQAIVIIHKFSGIPIFSKSYSILEKHNKELFSGFIQAITTIGEEFAERESVKPKMKESIKGYGTERIMELDFKYFYCLIADLEDVRAVLILKEKSSDRLKNQLRQLILALNLNLSEQLENWDGSLEQFQVSLPPILNEYFELYYKESFQLNIRNAEFLKMTKDKSLSKMEIRVLNVIISVAKSKENIINLDTILNLVHEENKDIIIKAIESLIAQKIIIPYKV